MNFFSQRPNRSSPWKSSNSRAPTRRSPSILPPRSPSVSSTHTQRDISTGKPTIEAIIDRIPYAQGAPIEVVLASRKLKPERLAVLVNFLVGRTHPFRITKDAKIVYRPEIVYLSELDLSKNGLDEHAAKYLSEVLISPKCVIESLNLSNNRLGINGMKILSIGLINNYGLHDLDVSDNWLTDKGVIAIRDALTGSEMSTLKRLSLSKNNITDLGAEALGQVLQTTSVCILDLSDNKISRIGAHSLGTAMSTNTALKDLNLERNLLGAEGGVEIGNGLLHQQCILTTLNLATTGLTDDGVEKITESLRTSTTSLHTLILHDCKLTDTSVTIIADALKVNTNLITLNLGANLITDQGMTKLLEALQINGTLENINLAFNEVSEMSIAAFADLVESGSNTTLQDIGISHTGVAGNRRGSQTDAARRLKLATNKNSDRLYAQWSTACFMSYVGRLIFHAIPLPEICLSSLPMELKERVIAALDFEGLLSPEQIKMIADYAKKFEFAWEPWKDDCIEFETEKEWMLNQCGVLRAGSKLKEN